MCVTYAAQPGHGNCDVGAERDITFAAKTKSPNKNPKKLPSGVLNCQPSESAHVAFYYSIKEYFGMHLIENTDLIELLKYLHEGKH